MTLTRPQRYALEAAQRHLDAIIDYKLPQVPGSTYHSLRDELIALRELLGRVGGA